MQQDQLTPETRHLKPETTFPQVPDRSSAGERGMKEKE
jgi:hypothetical protein